MRWVGINTNHGAALPFLTILLIKLQKYGLLPSTKFLHCSRMLSNFELIFSTLSTEVVCAATLRTYTAAGNFVLKIFSNFLIIVVISNGDIACNLFEIKSSAQLNRSICFQDNILLQITKWEYSNQHNGLTFSISFGINNSEYFSFSV